VRLRRNFWAKEMTTNVINSNASDKPETMAKTPAHQHVYERLRQMILFGDLAPGQPVTIQGLTVELAAGMTPVREALRRLISEGALTHQGNRRVSVPVLTAECADELYYMRKTLESELTRRAAQRMTPARLAALQACDGDLNQAIDQGDVGGYLTHNYRFHTLIYEGAAAPIISATVDRLWLRFGPSLRVICGRFGTSNLPDKHKDLLEALVKGDVEAATAAMAEDVEQGMLQVQAVLDENNSSN
jgi:DNA-binding GntR family transcriptional regulator